MPARYRAASEMNRKGNKPLAQPGPLPSMKRVTASMPEVGAHDDDADRQQCDGTDLKKGREVVSRCEQ